MKLSKQLLRKSNCRCALAVLLAHLTFFNASLPTAWAGPEGAQVVNGKVSIQRSANNTTITASDKAIINYSSFDIARPETVQFIQPGSSASVLNRILSANPTNIDGTLLANGRVFFVNPAGVYIGAGTRINVNQLVASGLGISDSDFINGRYNFVGGDGAVINNGDISAERAYLIGKQVTNSGTISCPAGYVVMAAGDRVFLGEPGSEIVLEMDKPSLSEQQAAEAAVLNEGVVKAGGGIVTLAAAGDIYSQAISNIGSLSTSIETGEAGEVKLIAPEGTITNTGTVEASGGEGGRIMMEAARVGQFGTVHADGTAGNGGSVNLTAGDVVAFSSDSLTTANAGPNGNGGEVIAYSPETALFRPDAKIEAKGGSESGDGGFVEVSGKKHVEIYSSVNTSAPSGNDGSFLIDPYDVTISSAADSPDGTWTGSPPDTFTPTASGSTINVTTLQTNLSSANVVVTTNTTAGAEGGDITVASPISYGSPASNNLTLQADNDIFVNSTITAGDNNLTLHATGNVNVNAAINMTSGNLTSSGVDFTGNSGGTITTTGGNVDLSGHSGAVDIDAAINSGGSVDIAGSSINVASNITGVGVTFANTVTADGAGAQTFDAGTGALTANGVINKATGDFTLGGDTDIDLNGAVTISTGSLTVGDPAHIAADITTAGEQVYGGSVVQTGSVTYTGVDTDADSEGVDFGSTVDGGGFNLTISGGGGFAGAVSNVAALTADHLDTESTVSSGTVAVSYTSEIGGDVTTTGEQVYAGALTQTRNVTYTGADTDADGEGVDFGSTVDGGGFGLTISGGGGFANAVSNAGSLTADHIDSESTISAGTVAVSGTSEIGGAVTTTGDQTYAGAVTLEGDADFDTTVAGNILFSSTVATGGYNLALDAGSAGNITLSNVLTGGGNVTVRDGAVQSYQALTVNSLDVQDAGTSVTFNGDITSATTVNVASRGTIVQNANITSGNIDMHSGTDGTGDIAFGAGVTLDAPSVALRAGDGFGGNDTTARVDIRTNTPTIPANSVLTVEQDGQFGTEDDPLTLPNEEDPWNPNVGDNATVDLTLRSHDSSIYTTDADSWRSITAEARNNIVLHGDGDVKIGGDLRSFSGGVSIVSTNGTVRTAGDTILDNVVITGYSDGSAGVLLPSFGSGTGKAAIVIRSESQDLNVGSGAALTANGIYSPDTDERSVVAFDTSPSEGGDPIDIAIYLGSYRHLPAPSGGNVSVDSTVSLAQNGAIVIDSLDTVTFGNTFESSPFDVTGRLEVVSRISDTLEDVIRGDRLPYALDTDAVRSWFDGTYVLRGKQVFAEILALTNPVPLVAPRPLEPEVSDEVEGPDVEALVKLLSELGLGVQPYVIEAYAASLSTDLRLYSAAEKLQQLIPILEDAEGTHVAGLRAVTAQFFPTLDVISDEQMDSFTQELASHKGDGTDFDLAARCMAALVEYVSILGNDIGWPADKSIGFVMSRYIPRLTEGDEIRIAVIQMQLQKAFGV